MENNLIKADYTTLRRCLTNVIKNIMIIRCQDRSMDRSVK